MARKFSHGQILLEIVQHLLYINEKFIITFTSALNKKLTLKHEKLKRKINKRKRNKEGRKEGKRERKEGKTDDISYGISIILQGKKNI